ncbi:MAG: hypothetical protein AB8G17_22010 [Gammaproteobacteria bacterium]
MSETLVTEQDKKRRAVRMAIGLGASALGIYLLYIAYFFVSAAG